MFLLRWLAAVLAGVSERWYRMRPAVVLTTYYRDRIARGQTELIVAVDFRPRGFKTGQNCGFERHIVVFIDASGSMAGAWIERARKAASAAVRQIAPCDSFTVIAFADTAWIVCEAASLPDDALEHEITARWAEADEAISRLEAMSPPVGAGGNTNYEAGLDLGFEVFDNSGATEGQGLFLSDGQMTHGNLDVALGRIRDGRKNGKVFSIACRRIGRGLSVKPLKEICAATFGGKVGVLHDDTDLESEFAQWVGAIYGTTLNQVRLHIRTDEGVELTSLLQTEPVVLPLTDQIHAIGDGEHVVHLGSMDNTRRQFCFRLAVRKPVLEGSPARLALVHVDYEHHGERREDPRVGDITWPAAVLVRFKPGKPVGPVPPEVTVGLDKIHYVEEVDAGMSALEAGDTEGASRHLSAAAQIAIKYGAATELEALSEVGELDAETGTVEVKSVAELSRGSGTMRFHAESSQTSFQND
jgi:hypothetical protein